MLAYLLRRLALVVPTLFGIMVLNFFVIQAAPGGPVEQMIAHIQGTSVSATSRFSGSASGGEIMQRGQSENNDSAYRGARGLPPELIQRIEKMYGFDKPIYERFWLMMKNYAVFDFGDSFFRNQRVVDLVLEKMPVSISLGLWTTLLVYLVSIPLGIAKAVRDGGRLDISSSSLLIVLNAIPGFLFAILLVVLFAGGSYFQWFPLRGLVSDDWHRLGLGAKVADYLWHMVLPITSMVVGGLAGLTFLTKNSFIDEIGKQYVLTARAKGLVESRVLYGHVFRNAMLIVIAGFPSAFVAVLFTGSLLTEVIFSLDGLGLLGFEAAINRDYPVIFGTLYFFGLIGLVMNIVGDFVYTIVDPRIDFATRGACAARDETGQPTTPCTVPRQPAWHDLARRVRRAVLPVAVRRAAGQRPADPGALRRAFLHAGVSRLSGDHLRRRPADQCRLHRPRGPEDDRGEGLDAVGADPLQLRHRRGERATHLPAAAFPRTSARHRRPVA
jgi:microcin C transport system permease protein